MGVTISNRVVALAAFAAFAAVAAIAGGAQALLPQAAAASPGAVARLAVVAGHAPSRAWPAGDTAGRGLRWEQGGVTADAIGKIFFTLGHADYVCSGALVRRGRVDVVLTAAHCVRGAHGQRATSWTFVPGYRDGAEPYGSYTARRFFVSPRWTGPSARTERYDVAFAVVTPVTRFGQPGKPRPPRPLAVSFAARQTAVALPRAYVLGYPSLSPFSGEYANYCAGPSRVRRSGPRAGSVTTSCAMTAGDSGGPWLTGFSPRGRDGAIAAVTAYKLSGEPRTLYGTVLGPVARRLYRAASRAWRTIPT